MSLKVVKYSMLRSKKIACFDCFSGISGDMILGALVDAGADIRVIENELKKIQIKGYSLTKKGVLRAGISATKVDVILKESVLRNQKSESKKWKDIEKIIKTSALSDKIKQKGLHIFKRLFQAEAGVHGETFENVHLHELGGVDCLIDVFGSLIGIDMLGIEEIYTSSINLGSGTVKTEHGMLPVPAPATIELLKGYPVYSSDMKFELTTPTGAAIVSGLKAKSIPLPEVVVDAVGYGAGNRDFPELPNALRILIGSVTGGAGSDELVTVIETNIDDMNPQFYEHISERLFDAGALDVFLENIIMKKGRPALKLSIVGRNQDVEKLSEILFEETTTIGARYYDVRRKILSREIKRVKTKYGYVRVKVSSLKGRVVNMFPEYEDVREISLKTGLPIKKITEEIIRLY